MPPLPPLSHSLLRGAEQTGMHKAVKPQFGGGMRRFSCEEDNIYENIESKLCFFTSQVRSEICEPCYAAHQLFMSWCVFVDLFSAKLKSNLKLWCYFSPICLIYV